MEFSLDAAGELLTIAAVVGSAEVVIHAPDKIRSRLWIADRKRSVGTHS
jgi:hypothetical protein